MAPTAKSLGLSLAWSLCSSAERLDGEEENMLPGQSDPRQRMAEGGTAGKARPLGGSEGLSFWPGRLSLVTARNHRHTGYSAIEQILNPKHTALEGSAGAGHPFWLLRLLKGACRRCATVTYRKS